MNPPLPTPAAVRAAWSGQLGHDDFTDEDSFFAVGGHSLRATRVMRQLSAQCQTRLPVRLLFDHPTVTGLAAAAERHVRETGQR